MKSYDMNSEPEKKEEVSDELEELTDDTLEHEDSDQEESIDETKTNAVYDHNGNELSIKKPMWKHSNKDPSTDGGASWHKMPSRMSTGDWLLTLLVLLIPIVNIILLILWAFFSDSVPNEKRNYARASIILVFVGLVAAFLLGFATIKMALPTNNLSYMKERMGNAIVHEIIGGQDEYKGLSDDDFTSD